MPVPDIIKQAARNLRKNQTYAEEVLWEKLRRKSGILKVYRQKPIAITKEYNGFQRYIIADFYFPQRKLIFEIDGSIHKKQEIYFLDREKEKLLQIAGYKIIRCTNAELLRNPDKIVAKLQPLSLRRRERIQERDMKM